MSTLAQRQLSQLRTQLDKDFRKAQKLKLFALREAIRAARKARQEKLKTVKSSCRAARERNRERAKRARARLQASIVRTRERARDLCQLATGEANTSTLQGISRALDALDRERVEQKQFAIWTRPKRKEVTRAEKLSESDDQVANNIDDPGLRIVWEKVKHKIKPGKRRSRTEAFFEWAAEHSADVYAIQEAEAERELRELERAERRLAKASTPRARRAALADVPF